MSCGAQTTTDSTPPTDPIVSPDPTPGESSSTLSVLCDVSGSEYNADVDVEETSIYIWSCSESERELTGNGIPNHEVGTFQERNPVSEQNISASFTLEPVKTDIATEIGGPRGTVAYALNSVKFDPGTAGTCNDSGDNCSPIGGTGSWSMEALGESSFNFGEDFNNAHVQPGGLYHYHGIPETFLTNLSEGEEAVTLVGWAADGFPVYARYGYSISDDASSAIVVIKGSYQTKAIPDENRPSTELYAMGAFTQDWEYVEGLGDLDECNGRVGVTPEFPEGIYHYYATDTFPFVSRCIKGEVEIRNRPSEAPARR